MTVSVDPLLNEIRIGDPDGLEATLDERDGDFHIVSNTDHVSDMDTDALLSKVDIKNMEQHRLAEQDTINAADHGYVGDPSQDGDIVELFNDNPNKTFILPKGDYAVRSTLFARTGWDELTIIGEPEARLLVDDIDVDAFVHCGTQSDPLSKVGLHNLTLVVDSANGLDAGWGRWYASDRIEGINLEIEGQRDYYNAGGDKYSYFPNITEPDGVGIHQNVRLPDGDTPADEAGDPDQFDHAIGVGVEGLHVGTNFFIGCSVQEYWDNGFYVKDGTGSNLLLGCYAANCGGANMRLGESDVAIACESVWDDLRGSDEVPHGVCFDSDEANATAAVGLRIIKHTGENDAMRFRTGAESVTYRDVYIENETDQFSIRCSADDGHVDTDDDSIAEIAAAKLDGIQIKESSSTGVRGAAVQSNRRNLIIDTATYTNPGGGSDRAFLEVTSNGGARVYNSHIEPHTGGLTVRQTGAGHRIEIKNSTLTSGIGIFSGGTLDMLRVQDCDLNDVVDIFPHDQPQDVVSEFLFSGNFGESAEYPRSNEPPVPYSGWVTYTDDVDGSLKAKSENGDVVTIATQGEQ